MFSRRTLVPLALSLSAALALGGAALTSSATAAGPPTTVVVRDSRTSAPGVDISRVQLDASWFWTAEQSLLVRVPNGFKAKQKLLVWFDVNGDSTPDGHYRLNLRKAAKPTAKKLRLRQEFRRGGGWSRTAGTRASCTNGDGDAPPVFEVRKGEKEIQIALDLWDCLGVPMPADTSSGSWRAAVMVAKKKAADMAPNGRRWSPAVAGWEPCDPSGDDCP